MVVLNCESSEECSRDYLDSESNMKLCHEMSSPQLLMPRLPKFKLNLDIPENDVDNEDICVINDTIDLAEKSSEYLLDSSYDNGHMEITQNLSNLHNSIGFGDISQLTLISRSNSSSSKLTTDDDIIRSSSSSNSVESVNFIVNLPFVTNFNSTIEEEKFLNRRIKSNNYNSCIQQWFYTAPFTKFSLIYDWVTRNFVTFIKKSFDKFCYIFGTIYTSFNRKTNDKKISDVVSIIRSENEYILCIFGQKMTNIMQELTQIRLTNEETLSVLKHEINVLKDSNRELTDKNETLTKDVKNISNILETVQLNNSRSVITETPTASASAAVPVSVVQKQQLQSSAAKRSISLGEFMTPPPPPPPLPPPPTPLSLSATPKTTKKGKTGRTPTRKASETLDKRPTITVEDLLKVTLKKAPQRNKENKKISQTPQGPLVSLDMLKNVKLKSTRRRSYDKTVRSPLRTLKECRSQSFSLSPIMTGAVSPLSRILKQTDGNRRGLKRILMSSIQSNVNEQTTKCPITPQK